MDKNFWESVYREKNASQMSWTQSRHEPSLSWIKDFAPNRDTAIIDVGGGISSLTHKLAEDGYNNLTVLDISSAALEVSKSNFKVYISTVKWIESDILSFRSENPFYVWHDRAVFHFLTNPNDRTAYLESVRRNLKVGGSVIIGTFSLTGPSQCSGQDVLRFDAESLGREFGDEFELAKEGCFDHTTPFNTVQNFQFCQLIFRGR